MTRDEFLEFYNSTVKKLGVRFSEDYPQFIFCENASSLYEEYLNQKIMLRTLYEKENTPKRMLLDRHKVCACMLVAIIKVRLLSSKIETDDAVNLSNASRINEQYDKETLIKCQSIATVVAANAIDRGGSKDANSKKFKKMAEKMSFWAQAIELRLEKEHGMTKDQVDKEIDALLADV